MKNNLTQSMNRKEFTKHCLASALLELLEKKEYDEISIQDIVDKAGFSRMGYYRNFKNIDEILDYYLKEITENFFKTSGIFTKGTSVEKFVAGLFHYLCSEDVKNLFILLNKRRLQLHFYRYFAIAYSKLDYEADPYLYSFFGSGYFGIFYKWISTGCKESEEELVAIVLNVIKALQKSN